MKCHFGGNPWQRLDQEAGRSNACLDRAERMFDCLTRLRVACGFASRRCCKASVISEHCVTPALRPIQTLAAASRMYARSITSDYFRPALCGVASAIIEHHCELV